ncbi:hypothetical protein [uncultured Bacteroides sp.]|uniref:hypothetical protein n=1 Tax=uncultured Bacteroides sp. TaxID=162156 RepID=UPI0026352040|nr:hypothetical protein [uncultured Bacteroides sp.]
MKTNRIFSALMIAALMCCGNVFAQEKKAQQKKELTPEQRMDMKVARMQKELMLNDATAAQFAPLYKEYLQAMQQCRPAKPECKKGECPKEKMTDAELNKKMLERFSMQKKAIETKETYFKKFEKILTARQLQKVFMNNDCRPHKMDKGNRDFKRMPKGRPMMKCPEKGCPMTPAPKE